MFAFALWKGISSRKFSRSEGETVTYLGPGVEFEGKIKVANGVIRVNTRVKGDVVSDGLVIVGDRGEVEATIQAKTVSVAGKVTGNIHVSDRLEIKEHGVVLGDVYTRVLTVEPGGYFEGQCKMPVPEMEKQPTGGAPSPTD